MNYSTMINQTELCEMIINFYYGLVTYYLLNLITKNEFDLNLLEILY